MGFLVNKITGDGTAQTAITNDATLEAVVNSLVAYNTTESGLNFTVSINGSIIFSESVSANSTYRLPDKINLGAISTLEVNAPIGLNVTVSYLQQAIDVVGALSVVQVFAQQADTSASSAVTKASEAETFKNQASASALSASNSADIVLSNKANIDLVATNITDISTINTNISDVIIVSEAIQTGSMGKEINDNSISTATVWSSKKIADELDTKQDALTFDTVPTEGSTNPVESSGVFDALATKLPLSGGTMTGAITAIRETKVAMDANNIDLATGNLFTKTITVATTLTISNALADGNANSFILELTNGGSKIITWWSGMKWAGGTAPTLTAAGVDILGFYSHDGGTTWRGMLMAKDSK